MNSLKKAKSKDRQLSTRNGAHSYEPGTATPNELCEAVRTAIIAVPLEDRVSISHKILSTLRNARVNVGSILLLLGIHAESVEELTPSDIGYLVRYIRINSPGVVPALKRPLGELFDLANRVQKVAESRRAA